MADDEPIQINCGGCGRPLLMTIEAMRDLRTVDCVDCASRRVCNRDQRAEQVTLEGGVPLAGISQRLVPPGARRRSS